MTEDAPKTISLAHGTNRNTKAYLVRVSGIAFYFSYETCIALSGHVDGKYMQARIANHWGPTTGRHFREMRCGGFPVLDQDDFDWLVSEALAS